MRSSLVVLAIILTSVSALATDFGFDFRSSAGSVTDPSYSAAVVIMASGNGQTYPSVYSNGAGQTMTAGWTSNVINGRNQSGSNDPRLSGVQMDASTGQTVRTFEITLPASGPYNVALAIGNPAYPETQCVALQDGTTAFATYKSVSTAANSFMDATGVVRTEAAWVSSNTTLAHTFAGTTFNVVIGCGAAGGSSTLAHVRITSAAGPAGNPPTLSTVAPSSGPSTGGTTVTLTGTNFLAGATVSFGTAAATSVTVVSATQITATTPAGSAGAVNVTVTNSNGQNASLASAFTYVGGITLSAVSPASGPTTGGTAVTLTGTGFLSGAAVSFGSTASGAVTVQSSTQMTALAPAASSAGAVNVTVTNTNGQHASLANAFTFVSASTLSLSSIAPASGPTAGGTAVTLTGTGFASGATVTFGSTLASSVAVVSSSQITAVTPAASAGAVNVKVANSSGSSATLAAAFTYQGTSNSPSSSSLCTPNLVLPVGNPSVPYLRGPHLFRRYGALHLEHPLGITAQRSHLQCLDRPYLRHTHSSRRRQPERPGPRFLLPHRPDRASSGDARHRDPGGHGPAAPADLHQHHLPEYLGICHPNGLRFGMQLLDLTGGAEGGAQRWRGQQR